MTTPNDLASLLSGKVNTHTVVHPRFGVPLHREVVGPLEKLSDAAAREGFELKVLSGFRDFSQQLRIWNLKATGQRALLDSQGVALDFHRLNEEEIVHAILRWSALPGASRHHWGTDLDIYDESARPQDYAIELTPAEVEGNGMFAPFHDWLDSHLEKAGFFRPYARDQGGVSPERWHLSYRPLSEKYLSQFSIEILEKTVAGAPIELKQTVLRLLPAIYKKFVLNICR